MGGSTFFTRSSATKHDFRTSKDKRFLIGPIGHPYGFLEGGKFNLTVYDFEVTEKRQKRAKKTKKRWWGKAKEETEDEESQSSGEESFFEAGFLLKRFNSESDFAKFTEEVYEDPALCSFIKYLNPSDDEDDADWIDDEDDDEEDSELFEIDYDQRPPTVEDTGVFLSLKDRDRWHRTKEGGGAPSLSHQFNLHEEGLYFLLYQVCPIAASAIFTEVHSTFALDISMHNYDKFGRISYLTAGDIPLPGMFLYFTISYALCLYIWTREIGKQTKLQDSEKRYSNNIVYQIHHMMTILLCLKMFSLFLRA